MDNAGLDVFPTSSMQKPYYIRALSMPRIPVDFLPVSSLIPCLMAQPMLSRLLAYLMPPYTLSSSSIFIL